MYNLKKRNPLLIALLSVLSLTSCSRIKTLHYGAFKYNNSIEDSPGNDFIEKNDGSRIYGENITWKSGFLLKKEVKVNGEKFAISEVRGIQSKGVYYGRFGDIYIRRIVHGKKINIYVTFTDVSKTSTDRAGFEHQHTYTRADYFSQLGESAPLIAFGDRRGMMELVKDCPMAVELLSLSNSKINREIHRNANYLNNVFNIYNNDCRRVDDEGNNY